MNKYWKWAIFLMILLEGVHIFGRVNSLYYTVWYFDLVLHIYAGFVLGLLWLGILGKNQAQIPKYILHFSILTFAISGSFIWELWEFSGWNVIPSKLVYVPELGDLLLDVIYGAGGGMLLSVFLVVKNSVRKNATINS